jgi:hypothetical protein
MPTFLSGSNRGWVRKLLPPAGAVGAIVSGIDINSCLITRVVVAEQTNHQFLHTLGNHIYAYVFGDRIGELGIGGLAYFDCDQRKSHRHGVGDALQWYRNHRLSRAGERISITVGGENLEGFLTGFRAETQQAESALQEFYLTFALIPDSRDVM